MDDSRPIMTKSDPDTAQRETERIVDPLLGTRIGKVMLESLIGRGSMGVVYRAHHASLEKPVAVKVLPDHIANDTPELIERFRREAVAAGKLEHTNVVQVYDVGHEGTHHYIVMQLVDGPSLESLIRKDGALPVERVREIAIGITRALEAAHAAGIVHRDVKPENILLGESVRLGDFGLASVQDSSLTESGRAIGTPHYMAPEQCQGDTADARSDLYALGGTLYYALTGKRPFMASTPLAIMMQKTQSAPPSVTTVRSDIPKEMEELVMRLLERDPAKRPQSAAEVLQALGEVPAPVHDAAASTLPLTPSSAKQNTASGMPSSDPNVASIEHESGIKSSAIDHAVPSLRTRVAGVVVIALLLLGVVYTIHQRTQPQSGAGGNGIGQTNTPAQMGVPAEAQLLAARPGPRSICVLARPNPQAAVDATALSYKLGEVLRQGGFTVVAREDEAIQAILQEFDLQRSGFVDPKKAIRLGQLVNARFMARPYCGAEEVLCPLVDLQTGKVEATLTVAIPPNAKADQLAKTLQEKIAAALAPLLPTE